MSTLSFRTPETTKAKLDFLANQQQRDRSFVINEAIDYYLSLQEWQLKHIQTGVEQAKNYTYALMGRAGYEDSAKNLQSKMISV